MSNTIHHQHKEDALPDGSLEGSPTPALLSLDINKYMKLVEGFEMTEAQKHEFLETLWNIMVTFVDLGFTIEPTQLVCGEVKLLSTDLTRSEPDHVISEKALLSDDFGIAMSCSQGETKQ